MYDVKDSSDAIRKAVSILQPMGYRILIAMPEVSERTKGGVYMPGELKDREATASIVGKVIAMGSEAYRDTERYPTGAWCRVGDTVVFRSYSGTRFRVLGQEFRLVNDDTIEAVVTEPQSIERA